MSKARTWRTATGVGVLAVLLGALLLVAPGASATNGDGVHGVDHNADLNPNQRGTTFGAAEADGECDDAPEEAGPYAWHFVTEAQDAFGQLNVDFQNASENIDVSYVAHPNQKHAYVSTSTEDTLLDATATVSPAPEGDEAFAKFQLSHTCDLSGEAEGEEQQETNSLTVDKAVTGEVPDEWEFELSGDVAAEPFVLDQSDSDRSFGELADGEYDVTEANHEGADLTDIDCDGIDDEEVDLDGRTVTVDLEGGQNVTCTFTNDFPETGGEASGQTTTTTTTTTTEAQSADLQIVKAVTGDAPDEWAFDYSGDLGTFTLDDTSRSETRSDLEPGEITVTEAEHDQADLVAIECDGTDDEEVDLDARELTVDLDAGDDLRCTFTNDFPEVLGEGEERETTTTTLATEDDEVVAGPEIEEDEQVVPTTEAPSPTTGEDTEVQGDTEERDDTEVRSETEVRPDVQERSSLPRTGSTNRLLTAAGLALLVLGTTLVGGSRWRLARVTA